MRVYIKFIISIFFRSLIFVFLVMASLVFILNLLNELEFFKNEDVTINFTLFLSLLNSPSLLFEMFPFMILLTIQLFFIKIFENKVIDVLKYSGLKNSKIILILCLLSINFNNFVLQYFFKFKKQVS